jgi:hypothetical protein
MFSNLINRMFGKPHPSTKMEIRFHTDANPYGEHGIFNVSHVKKGLIEADVSFVFVGVYTPPVMDLTLYIRIWEEARNQGYLPHHLVQYGIPNSVNTAAVMLSPAVIEKMQTPEAVKNAVKNAMVFRPGAPKQEQVE